MMLDLFGGQYGGPGQGDELIIDSFAGGGGASTGIKSALGRDPDVALNHDPIALAIHRANHAGSRHYCQDIFSVEPNHVTNGRPVGLLWASPDCVHFSKAKGGAPKRDAKIRDLAWAVVKWAKQARPRVIILENVEEFATWGPLTDRGEIIKSRAGETFRAWLRQLRRLGYRVEHRELRACDYGAPTIRKRFFLIARCDGQPIVWPEPTHGPGREHPYRVAADIIDWSIPCPSIFERKRPLAENTLRRIAEGIRRYVINAAEPFIVTYYGPKRAGDFRGNGIQGMLGTQTTENRHALVTPTLIQTGYGERAGQTPRALDIRKPLGTVVAGGGKHALVSAFLAQHNGGPRNDRLAGRPADAPMSTITATGSQQGLVAVHVQRDFGNSVGHPASAPCGTVTSGGGGKSSLVASHLVKLRGTCRHGQAATDPMPTVTAGGMHIGEVRAFLVKYFGCGIGQDARDPLHTVTTKDRFGLVTVQGEDYIIADIGLRMLTPRELFLAQGFPPDYVIDPVYNGKPLPKSKQVRACGNSVCPPLAEALVRANCHDMAEVEA
jgi:DNA (cytosine-5)-methyltransferase 1